MSLATALRMLCCFSLHRERQQEILSQKRVNLGVTVSVPPCTIVSPALATIHRRRGNHRSHP